MEDDITEITSADTEKVLRNMSSGKVTIDLTHYW